MQLLLRRIYICAIMILGVMTLHRFYLLSEYRFLGHFDSDSVFSLFLAGFRFDLLVVAFCLFPVTVFVWMYNFGVAIVPKYEFGLRRSSHSFIALWLLVVTLAVGMSNYFDDLQFAKTRMRLNPENLQVAIDNATPFFQYPLYKATFSFFVLVIVTILLFRRCEEFIDARPRRELWLSFLFTIIVFLSARGTVTAHHLNIEHSRVTEDVVLNRLALNPIWTWFNKTQ